MHLERGAQLRQKSELLREALVRTGGFNELAPVEVAGVGPELGYRSRLRVHVDEAGRIGLFARGSRRLVEVSRCIVCEPEVERALGALRELATERAGAFAAFAEIEIRAAPAGPPVAFRLFPRARSGRGARAAAEALSSDARELVRELGARFAVSIEGERETHSEQRYPLSNGVELLAPAGAFTQVNWAANRALIDAVVRGAASRGARTFCDLYCGAGNFTLPLSKAGLDGVGVDHAGAALAAAERAAREQGLGVRFVAGQVPSVLEQLVRRERHFDLVLLDPPRTGARDALDGVSALAPGWIAMCSCDPVTLARDLRGLVERGYALETVGGFDLFPQTHHVEALAWMRRGS